MKQLTFYITSKSMLESMVIDIKNLEEYKNSKTTLALIYVNGLLIEEAEEYIDILKKNLPDVKIAGVSVVTSNNFWNIKGFSLSLTFFKNSYITILEYDGKDFSDDQVIAQLKKEIRRIKDVKAVLTYPVEAKRDFTRILKEVTQDHEDIAFFGLMAGARKYKAEEDEKYVPEANYVASHLYSGLDDNSLKFILNYDPNIYPFIIGEHFLRRGFLFVLISGADINVSTKYILGWNPLGKAHIVTNRTSDEGGNACINEIDGKPAGDIYKQYLDVDLDDYFVDNVCEFPMIINRDGTNIARVPMFFGEKKELYFSGDIRDGEKVKLSFANPEDLIDMSRIAALELSEFSPEAMFLSVCFNRFYFLGDKQKIEREYFQEVLPDLLYGFGGYEILRHNNEGGILNSAIAVLALREGKKTDYNKKITIETPKYESKIKPIAERLHTFIDTATKDLEEAYDAAEKANEAKSYFLSNMSHEIRTPINAILGLSEMINRESKEEGIIRYSSNILRASYSLLGIVNDILDFSKIEAGKLDIIEVEYESASLINDIVMMIRMRMGEKDVDFETEISEDIPYLLFGDEIRIKQVIMNILSNAVKYTEQGTITFRIDTQQVEDDENKIILLVKIIDTGIGIKKEDLPKLFNTFERIEERRNRTIEGTGLGMNITRNLLRRMGSDLNVESEYGKGSVFSFALEQVIIDKTPIGSMETALNRSISENEEQDKFILAPNARILVVDDTIINLFVVENLLRRTQIIIDTADSGEKCIQLVQKNKYDIIFLDHRMPGMDGVETLKELKKLNILNDTPVIALTANAISGSREYYLENGFDDYMSKPIEGIKLEQIIMNYLPKEKYKLKENLKIEDDTKIPESLTNSILINVEHGIQNCASKKTYMETLKVYFETLADKKSRIQETYNERDLENFMINVHSLKSTSKIIGALTLGNYAERIEEACNEKNLDFVHINYPELIVQIQKIMQLLKLTFREKKKDGTELKPVTKGILLDAFNTMAELAQVYDYDTMGMLLEKFDEYDIPEHYRDQYEKFKKAYKNADWDGIFDIIREVT